MSFRGSFLLPLKTNDPRNHTKRHQNSQELSSLRSRETQFWGSELQLIRHGFAARCEAWLCPAVRSTFRLGSAPGAALCPCDNGIDLQCKIKSFKRSGENLVPERQRKARDS